MEKTPTDCHLSKPEAARYLGRSKRWLEYLLASSDPPPGFKVGTHWIFKKSELDAWLEQFRVTSQAEKKQ